MGEHNFLADIIWKHTQQSKNDELHFSRQYNHTLCFSRNINGLHRFYFARTEEDNKTEYLDYVLSVKTVSSVDEAIDHINYYGSHHTDCIVTENIETAEYFMGLVDSAGVYQNCSTRFADGYRYGFGAEVGISTGKLHARGPVGLEGLVSYKYKLFGNGHIVDDYATGKKQFHFKEK